MPTPSPTPILIKNGHVIDPKNRVDANLDLYLEDGIVKRVFPRGQFLPETATQCPDTPVENLRVIDAAGCIVSPGFLDIHMHEDPLDEEGQIRQCIFPAMLRMGVTTVLAGNCGDNVSHPISYLNAVREQGCAVNVAMLAGHTYFRNAVGLTDKYAPASKAQIESIKDAMAQALSDGCTGLSFGLRYVPGMTTEEFLSVAEVSVPGKRLISAHVRDDAAYIFDAVREFALAGERYQMPLQVSHIGSMGGFGQMEELLAMLDAMRANGMDICADCYPYDAFCTGIGESTYDDGWLMRYGCGYDAVELCEGPYRGQRCTKETFEEIRRTRPQSLTVCHVMRQEDVTKAMLHPNVCLGSDGTLHDGQGHPRAAGAFPRFLAEYVRTGLLPLSDAIAKMTSLPASRMGLTQKGHLGAGADADIVIFDPNTIRDNATFETPLTPPDGVRYVLLGGQVALEDGVVLDEHLGRAMYYKR